MLLPASFVARKDSNSIPMQGGIGLCSERAGNKRMDSLEIRRTQIGPWEILLPVTVMEGAMVELAVGVALPLLLPLPRQDREWHRGQPPLPRDGR